MDYKLEIEDLLTNYKKYKKEIVVHETVGNQHMVELVEKIKFLEYCISIIDDYQKELLYAVCINGMSIRNYATSTGLSRNFITLERQKMLEELNKYFQIKYQKNA